MTQNGPPYSAPGRQGSSADPSGIGFRPQNKCVTSTNQYACSTGLGLMVRAVSIYQVISAVRTGFANYCPTHSLPPVGTHQHTSTRTLQTASGKPCQQPVSNCTAQLPTQLPTASDTQLPTTSDTQAKCLYLYSPTCANQAAAGAAGAPVPLQRKENTRPSFQAQRNSNARQPSPNTTSRYCCVRDIDFPQHSGKEAPVLD